MPMIKRKTTVHDPYHMMLIVHERPVTRSFTLSSAMALSALLENRSPDDSLSPRDFKSRIRELISGVNGSFSMLKCGSWKSTSIGLSARTPSVVSSLAIPSIGRASLEYRAMALLRVNWIFSVNVFGDEFVQAIADLRIVPWGAWIEQPQR